MTAVTSHSALATPLDRALLRASIALDRFVAARAARRVCDPALVAATQHDLARSRAQALGAIGMPPR